MTSQLLQLRERIGPFGSLVLVAHDWDDRPRWLRSLELFATEVVPRFNAAIATANKQVSRRALAPRQSGS